MRRMNSIGAPVSEAGFSLVQVMVAMGLAGGLSLYLMTLSENQMKSQKTIEMKAEIQEIDALMRRTLRDKKTCYNTFKGIGPGQTLDGIRVSDDTNVPYFAEVEKRFKNTGVSIDRMYILKRSEEEDKDFNDGVVPIRAASIPAITNFATGEGTLHLRVTYSKGINSDDKTRFLGGKTIMKTYEIPGIFGEAEVVWYCGVDHQTELEKCEPPVPPPGGIRTKWEGNFDPANLVEIGKSCLGDGTKGYIGTCTTFKDTGVLLDCNLPEP